MNFAEMKNTLAEIEQYLQNQVLHRGPLLNRLEKVKAIISKCEREQQRQVEFANDDKPEEESTLLNLDEKKPEENVDQLLKRAIDCKTQLDKFAALFEASRNCKG